MRMNTLWHMFVCERSSAERNPEVHPMLGENRGGCVWGGGAGTGFVAVQWNLPDEN